MDDAYISSLTNIADLAVSMQVIAVYTVPNKTTPHSVRQVNAW